MKNKLIWYANRLQSMSNREVLYRIKKHIQGRVEKLATKKNKFPFLEDYEKVFTAATELPYNTLPQELIEEFRMYNQFHFFSYTIDITQPIHWHKDISTNKKFPLKFSKNINIRSDEYGNAKIVWEINRLQFLLPLAIKCRLTKNEDDLNLWMDIMKSWVTANPYLKGVNWYSNIEVNIRLIIWHYCWQILYGDEKIRKNKKFIEFTKTIWLPSIYEHCRYSYKNPSKYSSANNHAIAEYAGLFVASCCWHFTQSATWKAYAQKGLEKQIIKQHSENGINKEEAAEYIQFITDFLLIALAVGQQYKIEFSTQYKKYLQSIFNYILNLLDIKGNYPKYGDEDDGKVLLTSTDTTFNNFLSILTSAAIISNNGAFKWRAPIFDIKNWLLWGDEGQALFSSITEKPVHLNTIFYEKEGHLISRKTDFIKQKEIYLHINTAPLGFLSIAAHGHADALSIILHIDGYPFIVDAGTYTYHTEPLWRKYFVSTAAHNTINIDGKNQAVHVGPTMWKAHYETSLYNAKQYGSYDTVYATHNGYASMQCNHARNVNVDKEKEKIHIIDTINVNKRSHAINLPWYIHPTVNVHTIDEHTYILKHPKASTQLQIAMSSQLKISVINGQKEPINGWYSKSFLQKEPTNVIVGKMYTTHSQEIKLETILQCI